MKSSTVMQCVFCKTGETEPGTTTITLDRAKSVVVIREVPADVCRQCGEAYLSTEVAQKVSARADDAVRKGVEVEIVRFAA